MDRIFQIIINIVGALLSITFFILEILKWRSSLKVQDSETCIIVRSHGKHLFCLIYALFSFILFLFSIITMMVSQENIFNGSFLIFYSLYILFILYQREYRFTDKGIQVSSNSNIITWERTKSWKWLEYKEDVLWVAYDKGYIKVRAKEKKELITAFLQKYKSNTQ